MTPRETLEKYGLATDVKSIRERIEKQNYLMIAEHNSICQEDANVLKKELRTADLTLLCELAEKGERYEKAVKHRYKNEKALVQSYAETWGKSHIENAPKHIQDGYMELHSQHSLEADKLARIIVEAEGEPK